MYLRATCSRDALAVAAEALPLRRASWLGGARTMFAAADDDSIVSTGLHRFAIPQDNNTSTNTNNKY